jgi:hypothetical protein
MKILEFSPFNNENLVANIKAIENSKWINELHITESNKTFSYHDKEYCLDSRTRNLVNVKYHMLDGNVSFIKPGYGLSRNFPFFNFKHRRWVNEAIQRNSMVPDNIKIQDSDIIIVSDIDEIINPRFSDEILMHAKQRGIVTIKMYNTVHYVNLLSSCGGPKDWSYRVFIMTGAVYKNMNISVDQLRKKGERGQICNEVYCLPFFAGYHHSWLGDMDFLINKFNSYSHHPSEFNSKILMSDSNEFDVDYIKNCIANKKSIFNDGEILEILNSDLLDSVESLRITNPNLFFYD